MQDITVRLLNTETFESLYSRLAYITVSNNAKSDILLTNIWFVSIAIGLFQQKRCLLSFIFYHGTPLKVSITI